MADAQDILIRMKSYINSASFTGSDKERFSGDAAINSIIEGGLDQLSGLSENEIVSHVSRTSLRVGQEPRYKSPFGVLQMGVEIPSTIIEGGKRITEKGFKQGLKETGQAYIGSRPYKLSDPAKLVADIFAPYGIFRGIKAGAASIKKIADMPRKARISHIGKTKARFKQEKMLHKKSGRVGSSSVSSKQNDLAAAYNRMVNAPAQWPTIKKKAAEIIKSVDPISKYTFTGLSRSIRRNIDSIVSGKGSPKIKAQRIDKILFEHFNSGALKQSEVRAFNVYGADKLKHKVSIPLAEEISKASPKSKLHIGKGVKAKPVSPKRKYTKKKKIVDTTPRTQPSAKPTPEQQVGSKAGVILEKIFNEKIKEFKAKSDVVFKKVNPKIKYTPKEL